MPNWCGAPPPAWSLRVAAATPEEVSERRPGRQWPSASGDQPTWRALCLSFANSS